MIFEKWCIYHDIHIYIQHFWIICIYNHPYLSIGTLKTNIAPIVRWVYLFNFFYDHALIIALVMYGPTVPICEGLIFDLCSIYTRFTPKKRKMWSKK